MDTKQTLHAIRLLLGAAQAEAEKSKISPEFVPLIAKARADINLMRGTAVLDALVMLQRSGLSLVQDVREPTKMAGEKSERLPGR